MYDTQNTSTREEIKYTSLERESNAIFFYKNTRERQIYKNLFEGNSSNIQKVSTREERRCLTVGRIFLLIYTLDMQEKFQYIWRGLVEYAKCLIEGNGRSSNITFRTSRSNTQRISARKGNVC